MTVTRIWLNSGHRISTCTTQELRVRQLQRWKMAGIDRLPCGYLYRSSQRMGKRRSGLHPFCCHRGGRLFMGSCEGSHPQTPGVLFAWHKTCKIRAGSDFMVSGRSKQAQANIHTHMCNEVILVLVWGSLRLPQLTDIAVRLGFQIPYFVACCGLVAT